MTTTAVVVDDAALMRRVLADILEAEGFEVIAEAENGQEAIDTVLKHRPDFVTMDMMMPIKTGIEAVREILADAPDTRIMMVSSMGREELINEALSAGAKGYVLKPIRKEDVLETARKIIGGS